MSWGFMTWRRRPSAASRRAGAARRIRDATKRGKPLSPVEIVGRTIARTFWGKAWCDNLERYRDFAYRLERGRSYVRSGAVIDLQIGAGQIDAQVCGSSVYDVAIHIAAVEPDAWRAIRRDCAGSIGSRVDLLTGTLSDAVMARLCADRIGLFPAPQAIRFTCSCPDYAIMCKHVAATMYGVGARLDHAPELLFTLRRASVDDLVTSALSELPASRPRSARVLAADGLAAMFGIELAESPAPPGAMPVHRNSKTPAKPPVNAKASAEPVNSVGAIASRDSLPASSAAEGRRGSIASRDSLPASSAAEGRRGSIESSPGRAGKRPRRARSAVAIASRDSLPASSAAEGRRGSIESPGPTESPRTRAKPASSRKRPRRSQQPR